MAVNGKRKGSSFELKIARLLKQAFPDKEFQRVFSSGARLGGVNSKNLSKYSQNAANHYTGDIVCINDDDFRYSVECKNYKECENINSILLNRTKIHYWWEQCKIDAAKTDKVPLLVFKWNRTDIFIATLAAEFKELPLICIKYEDAIITTFTDFFLSSKI